MLEFLGKKVLGVVGGIIACIIIWQGEELLGCNGSATTADRIPEVVLDGGGAEVFLELDASRDTWVTLSAYDGDDAFSASELLAAGNYEIGFELPFGAEWFLAARGENQSQVIAIT